MPQPYKGLRKRATVRLPVPVFDAAARNARERRWCMTEYVAYCVEQQVRRDADHRNQRRPVAS